MVNTDKQFDSSETINLPMIRSNQIIIYYQPDMAPISLKTKSKLEEIVIGAYM